MRIALAAAVAAVFLLALPATAQERAGDRTMSPERMLAELLSPDQDDLRDAIAAAATRPLGTVENPVRVGGPDGERAYIARLRCADGSAPRVGSRTDAGVGAFGTVVDAYPLDCGVAAPGRFTIVMDMYHEEHREDRAPAGFSIEPL